MTPKPGKTPGTWIIRVDAPKADGKRRQISRTIRGGKRKAIDAERALRNEVEQGLHDPTDTAMPRLAQWLTEYIEARDLKPETISNYTTQATAIAATELGKTPIDQITATQLRQHLATTTGPVGQAQHKLIRAALNMAVRERVITHNPALDISAPKHQPETKRIAEIHEIHNLIAAAHDSFRPIIEIAARTGARRGEIAALQWPDIDLQAATITIGHNLTQDGRTLVRGTPKGGKARKLAIDAELVQILTQLRAQQRSHGMPVWVASFEMDGSKPRTPDSISRAFKRIAESIDIYDLTFHDLRHWHASTLISQGVGLADVAARLGHSSPAITAQVYAHAIPGQDERSAQVVGAALGRLRAV